MSDTSDKIAEQRATMARIDACFEQGQVSREQAQQWVKDYAQCEQQIQHLRENQFAEEAKMICADLLDEIGRVDEYYLRRHLREFAVDIVGQIITDTYTNSELIENMADTLRDILEA